MPIRVIRAVGHLGGVRDRLLRRGNSRPDRRLVTRGVSLPIREIHRVVHITRRPMSVRAPVNPRRSSHLVSFVHSRSTLTPSRTTLGAVAGRSVSKILGALAPHRRTMVHLEFNLVSNEYRALRRINSRFGMAERHVHRVRTGTLEGLHRPMEDGGFGSE